MKAFFIASLLFLTCLTLHAQDDGDWEKTTINFDADNEADTISMPYANIFIKKEDTAEENKAKVTVTIENIVNIYDGEVALLLFRTSLDEKSLKSKKVKFDKGIGGTKGSRRVMAAKDLDRNDFVAIDQDRNSKVTVIRNFIIDDTREHVLQLPIYVVQSKGKSKKKYTIFDQPKCIQLNITYSTKPDQGYIDMEKKVDKIKSEIEKNTYCRENKRGKKKWDDDHARITKMKKDIDDIVNRHGWYQTDRPAKRYAELKEKLDGIIFTENCKQTGGGKKPLPSTTSTPPSPPPHSCRYCSYSSHQIWAAMNGASKSTADALYNCAKARNKLTNDINRLYRQIQSR